MAAFRISENYASLLVLIGMVNEEMFYYLQDIRAKIFFRLRLVRWQNVRYRTDV